MFDQNAKYMDHYEQGLYNHILASVVESDPGNTYHVPFNPGALRFSVDGIAFKPFYETYGRYSVYLNVTLK